MIHLKFLSINNVSKGLSKRKNQKIFFFSVIMLTLAGGFFASRIKFDFELEKLFPKGDPDLNFYQTLVSKNGYDNDFLLIYISPEYSFFEKEFLTSAADLIDSLKKLNGTKYVADPLSLPYLIKSPTGIITIPVIHPDRPAKYRSDSLRITNSDFHRQYFNKFESISIYLRHSHFDNPDKANDFYNKIKLLLEQSGLNYNISGKIPAENAFRELIKRDFFLYLFLSIVISILAMGVIYRKWSYVFLPLIVGVMSMILTFGTMAAFQIPISIMSVLLPPLLLFTASSDTIHLINASKTKGLMGGIRKVLKPTLLTSITTAIGFMSLVWISVEPVMEFGISASIGVVFAFLITYSIVPFILYKIKPEPKGTSSSFYYELQPLRRPLTFFFISVFVVAGFGISKMEIDAYLLDDLPDESEIKNSFQQMDEDFGGSKPWMLFLWSDSLWSDNQLDQLRVVKNYLKERFPIPVLNTPFSAYEYADPLTKSGKRKLEITRSLTRNTSDTSMVFTGFIPEWGSKLTMEKHARLERFLKKNLKNINWRITGTTYLIDKSHHYLSKNLFFGLLTAILTVSVCMGLFFRSVVWGWIALVPNLLTLTTLAGIIGYSGIPLQLSNAIIFSVAFGVVVDDTIHFITAYRDQNPSLSRTTRINNTIQLTGRSILYTSLIIMAGFSIFLLSSFGATYYLGLFMVISVFLALLVDLFFLPLILPGKK